jgi:hypothetical protein
VADQAFVFTFLLNMKTRIVIVVSSVVLSVEVEDDVIGANLSFVLLCRVCPV